VIIPCPTCEGRGMYEVEDRRFITTHSVNQVFVEITCSRCHGTGEIDGCSACGEDLEHCEC